jgi:tetratricopeptide (TPR) repeat protein
LHEVCTKYPPSIVIDDGSHLAHHIVYTFKRVFPALLAGGLYLVEDVEFHFGDRADRWAGNKTVSVPDYFLGLARGRLANNTALSDVWGDDKYVRDNVDSISFLGGALAVGKRKPRDMRRALSFADQYLQSIGPSPALLLRLVEYTLRHGGPLDFAERAARQAVTIGGLSPEALRWLVEILTRQGRPDEAAALAGEALQLRPDDHTAWERLAHAERLRGRRTEAIAALERAASLNPQIGHYHSELSHLLQQGGELARALTSAQKAARLHPEHEPWQRRVMDLEQLAASV